MQIVRNIKSYKKNSTFKTVTIGNFDGLHLGHRALISKLTNDANSHDGESHLITFSPHPAQVLFENFKIELIQTESQFIDLLEQQGLSTLIIEEFNKEYSSLTADQFFHRIYDQLEFDKLLIGYDFKFGKDKIGNFDFLLKKSKEFNFELEKIKPFELNKKIVSSTLVRGLISAGEIELANNFLGRKYSVQGVVVKGAGKGSQIGFPTLNLACENSLFLKHGVYETNVIINNKSFKSITNFGRAPTLKDEQSPIIETHILNKDMNCYGLQIEVEFCKFIRPEIKFSSVDELILQINTDISTIDLREY